MKITLAARERAAIAAVMHRAPWLGGRAILWQRALYNGLKLGEFMGKDGGQLLRLSLIDRTAYEVPDESAAILSAILSVDGQSCDLALINAGTLERLDPLLTVAVAAVQTPPAPPPGDDDDKTPKPGPKPADPPADPPPVAASSEVERTKQVPKVPGPVALGRLVRNGHRRRAPA